MGIELASLPRLPDALLEAAAVNNLVPFVGAGASMLAGCVSWAGLASKAIDSLVQEKALSALQRSQLAHLPPRLKLSLAEITAREKRIQIPYREILQPDGWSDHKDGRRIYGHLGAISSQFVTTNYDGWLDINVPPAASTTAAVSISSPPLKRDVLYQRADISPAKFRSGSCVLHLHGSIAEPGSMILTTSDYISHYAADRDRVGGDGENPVLSFLSFLFSTRTVLFLGYGLEELEILEYVILKSRSTKARIPGARHFIVQGFYSIEADLCRSLAKYYEEWGVTLIPFLRDDNDWAQLIDVVDYIARSLPTSREPALATFADMKRMLHG